MASDQRSENRAPRVLLLYYTYTGQALKVLEAAGEVFRERGCEVQKAEIEFTDPRFAERFSRFPMRHVVLDFLSVLPAQTRRARGEIRTPDEVRNGKYDLICIGSSTWWLTMNMPMHSFLKSDEAMALLAGKPFPAFAVCRRFWRNNFKTVRKLGEKQGGLYVDGIHFEYPGGQIRSLLSLASYFGSDEYRDRYVGVRLPPTNVQPEQLEQTRKFAACPRGSVVRNGIGDGGRGTGGAAMSSGHDRHTELYSPDGASRRIPTAAHALARLDMQEFAGAPDDVAVGALTGRTAQL